MSARTLLLVDGHALVHRAFHAIPASFMTSRGEPTNAVYGFTHAPESPGRPPSGAGRRHLRPLHPTFRHLASVDYKANRPASRTTCATSSGACARSCGPRIPIYEKDGFEADDVLGTLARQATAEGVQTVIVTGDMDTLQLVDEQVRVLAPRGRIRRPSSTTRRRCARSTAWSPPRCPT